MISISWNDIILHINWQNFNPYKQTEQNEIFAGIYFVEKHSTSYLNSHLTALTVTSHKCRKQTQKIVWPKTNKQTNKPNCMLMFWFIRDMDALDFAGFP